MVQRFCANPRPVKLREVMEYDKKIREFEADRAAWLAQQVTTHVIDMTDSVMVVKHLMSFRNSDSRECRFECTFTLQLHYVTR